MRLCFEFVLGAVLGVVSGLFWVCFGVILRLFWGCFGDCRVTARGLGPKRLKASALTTSPPFLGKKKRMKYGMQKSSRFLRRKIYTYNS